MSDRRQVTYALSNDFKKPERPKAKPIMEKPKDPRVRPGQVYRALIPRMLSTILPEDYDELDDLEDVKTREQIKYEICSLPTTLDR